MGTESPLGTEWRDVDSVKATGGRDADPFGTAERRDREIVQAVEGMEEQKPSVLERDKR